MKHPHWYPGWRDGAFKELVEKNQRLDAAFKIGHWSRYDYDLPAGTLKFSEEGVVKVIAEIQVAGSTQEDDWQWAWSNENLPPPSTIDAALVRTFGQENRIQVLGNAHTRDSDVEALGWTLSAVMVRVTNALGVYRSPLRGGGFLFVTLKNVAWAG